jgi:hypothetical protein
LDLEFLENPNSRTKRFNPPKEKNPLSLPLVGRRLISLWLRKGEDGTRFLVLHLPFEFGLEFSGIFGKRKRPKVPNTIANGKGRTKLQTFQTPSGCGQGEMPQGLALDAHVRQK